MTDTTAEVPIVGVVCTESLLGVLASHTIPGLERFDAETGSLTRLIKVETGFDTLVPRCSTNEPGTERTGFDTLVPRCSTNEHTPPTPRGSTNDHTPPTPRGSTNEPDTEQAGFDTLVPRYSANEDPQRSLVEQEGRPRPTVSKPAAPTAYLIKVQIEADRVLVTADTEVVDQMAARVSDWLDLTTDTSVFEAAWRDDPVLGPLVAARPGIRVVKHWDPYEAMITTVLGQQVSLAAGRLFAGRLVAAYGAQVSCASGGLSLFPTAERLAGIDVEELRATVGLTGARARTVSAVARAWADGLTLDGDPADVRRRLLALPGIGPWTVDQLSVRVLGDPEAFSAGDLVLRRALGGVPAVEAAAIAERWRPWRAYALLHLWTAAAYT